MTLAPPQKLTLYTSQISIFGHRVKILLHRLQLPYTEVLIPLDRPREPWYLAINPRGLVPALEVEDVATGKKEAIIESALICRFLLDLVRSWDEPFAARAAEVYPQGHDLATATARYRQDLAIDTYFAKLREPTRTITRNRSEEALQAFVAAAKELDPFCPEEGRFFGNSNAITLVEVLTGPHMVRIAAALRWGTLPDFSDKLRDAAPRLYGWMKKLAEDKGMNADIWDDELMREYTINLYNKRLSS